MHLMQCFHIYKVQCDVSCVFYPFTSSVVEAARGRCVSMCVCRVLSPMGASLRVVDAVGWLLGVQVVFRGRSRGPWESRSGRW